MPTMRAGTRRRVTLFLHALGGTVVVGAVIGGANGFGVADAPVLAAMLGALGGATNGVILMGAILGAEIFLPPTRLGRALERMPFLVAFGMSAIFVLQVGRLIGERTLRDIGFGRYHRSRTAERFFLFVDIAGSTSLAERIGPAAVHRFFGEVFRLVSDPIDDHRGEVHQYVGDEIVVAWTVAERRAGARSVACFFGIEERSRGPGRSSSGRLARCPASALRCTAGR